MHQLAKEFPGAELAYLIGGDSLRDMPTWYHPQELVDACATIGVMRRPGDEVDFEALERQLPGIMAKLAVVTAPLLQVSASEIRARIAAGKPFRYYLPEAVYTIIKEKGLYSQKEG